MVLYGQSPPGSSNCWDITSTASLTHDGGDDSTGIASAVEYALQNWNIDPEKVFVTGTSSGAMMTNVMSGSYPELFQAASIYSGVAFGCFAGSNSWNSACADGDISQTAQQWVNILL